ncbi:Replication protein A 32 kDa subunit [Oopsacas minuta]|uniref:Replication protein A 32 kDa subunit n=1 Tax=Oopsacas minuta TaxID=111878 RepID=A0AAV7JBM9_9METZ|nr:Replication protein A 32 kDa subunit [Oopsacas minuta]
MATGGIFSSGGGYMQDTSPMDMSFGASSSSKGPTRREHTGGRLVPVTALMIKRAADNKKSEGDDFILNGEIVNQVRLVGQVRTVQETNTYCGYTLNDSSGALVEVKRWTNVDDGVKEQNVRADIREGTYCCVIGNLRSFGDKTNIGCFTIYPLKSMNEITRHLLEVSHAYLEMTHAHYRSESMQMDSTPSTSTSTTPGIVAAQVNSVLSPIHRDTCEVLRNCHKQFGLHIDEVVGRLGAKYSAEDIRKALEFLCSEGLVFNSSDEDHFQSADS